MRKRLAVSLAAPLAFAIACAAVPPADMSTMRFVQSEGVPIHVASWGDPTKPSVLMIHGASSDMGVFAPSVIPVLEKDYFLSAYDRPGMGYSQRPANSDLLKVQADVAADVIDQMGLKKPIIVTHSWAGAVGLRLALDHPDKISGLVLISPVAYEWPGGVTWYNYWSATPLIGDIFNIIAQPFTAAALSDGIRGTFAPMAVNKDYVEKAGSARATRPSAMRANALDLVNAKREIIAQQARYPEIKIPIAILAGDKDDVVWTDLHSRGLAKTLPETRLEVLPGVGHLPQEAAPEKVAELVAWVRAKAAK